jgi:hypothetical protein
LTFSGIHGIMSKKIELFIASAVRTSDPPEKILLDIKI